MIYTKTSKKSLKNIKIEVKNYDKILLYTTGYIRIFESYFSDMYNTTNWIKRGYSDQVSKENANALETNRLSYKNIIKDIEGGK